MKQFFTGDKRPSVDLKGELKKLIFTTSGDPLIACENAGTFTMVMSTFAQYEKHVSTHSYKLALSPAVGSGGSVVPLLIGGGVGGVVHAVVMCPLCGGLGRACGPCLFPLSSQAKSDKTDSSHSDVNDALKNINRHLTQTFIRDFPFYLVVAYKMHT